MINSSFIEQGRLAIRTFKEGCGFVGLVKLNPFFQPEEGKSYLVRWSGNAMELIHDTLTKTPLNSEEKYRNINAWLTSQSWHKTTHPDFSEVRFFNAFPETNDFVIFGLKEDLPAQLIPLVTADTVDLWVDIEKAQLKASAIENSRVGIGNTLGGLCRFPVWPRNGENYSMSGNPSALQELVVLKNKILVHAFREGWSAEKRRQEMDKAHPEITRQFSIREDREFEKYLSHMEASYPGFIEGGIKNLSESELKQRSQAAKRGISLIKQAEEAEENLPPLAAAKKALSVK
jgi:hypothetical protein